MLAVLVEVVETSINIIINDQYQAVVLLAMIAGDDGSTVPAGVGVGIGIVLQ